MHETSKYRTILYYIFVVDSIGKDCELLALVKCFWKGIHIAIMNINGQTDQVNGCQEKNETIRYDKPIVMILATSGQRSYNIRTSIPEISGHGFL